MMSVMLYMISLFPFLVRLNDIVLRSLAKSGTLSLPVRHCIAGPLELKTQATWRYKLCDHLSGKSERCLPSSRREASQDLAFKPASS
jgi:hypothetical protein